MEATQKKKKRGRVYNRIYTPELWKQVNPKNKEILDDFIQEYKQRKKAQGTIHGYFEDARILFIYVLKFLDNKTITELKRKDFRRMTIWLSEECQMSASRVNRLKTTMNTILTYCEEDDDYDYEINQSKKVKGVPKRRVKEDDKDFFFSFDEFIQVRDILVERNRLQDAVLWSLAFDSAGRRNEIYQVKKHGLLDGNKTNIVIGKREKTFTLFYLDDTKELIRQYLEARGEDDVESLWYKDVQGEHQYITYQTLYTRVLGISDILSEVRKEPCNIFFHSIRHARLDSLSRGTDLRLKDKKGKPIKFSLDKIMKFAHHNDVSTTQSYLMNRDDEEIEEMFGLGKTDGK